MYEQKVRAFQVAKQQGLRVSVAGEHIPAWAEPYVDAHIPVRTDTAAEMELAVSELRARHTADPFDGVITFWDHGVVPAAEVAQALGLPGDAAAARTARNKAAMRAALAAHGVPCPASVRVTSWEDLREAAARVGYPAIYKPTGGAGSAGIFAVANESQLRAAYDAAVTYAAPEADPFFAYYPGEFVYEEYVSGREVSVEGVVSRKEVRVCGVSDKLIAHDAYFTEYQNSFPAEISEAARQAAIDIAVQAVQAVGLDACGFHVEVMLTSSGAKVIEVNARLGGNFIASHLVPLAGSDELIASAFQAAFGEPVELGARPAGGSCVRYLLAARPGTVRSWDGVRAARECPGVAQLWVTKHVGDQVLLPPASFFDCQTAHVITVGRDTAEAVQRAGYALDRMRCHID
ncbi:MAG TPA: ATP-grasp domain-containing protein [Streptosporangiaceae bacterium]|nr:ATP-grasp domain-containing protein [Streptosporangiaceae bacterium]